MKRFLLSLTSLILIFSLIGCSSDTNTSKKKNKHKKKSKETTIEETIDTEESSESTEESTIETSETEIIETSTSETEDVTTNVTNISIVKDNDYIDTYVEPYSYQLNLNDNTYSIYTSLDYLYTDYGYISLSDSLDKINSDNEERINTFIEDQTKISTYSDKDKYFFDYCSITQNLCRTDKQVLSGYSITDMYLSASGAQTVAITTYNFDSETGNSINLSELITNEDQFRGIMYNSIWNQDFAYEDFEDTLDSIDFDNLDYVITTKGIQIIFAPGLVLPVSSGIYTYSLEYSYEPDLFRYDLWSNYPSDRITKSYSSDTYDFFYNEDDLISFDITYTTDEYDTYNSVTISNGSDVSKKFDFWGFDHESYLVEIDGKSYIYIKTTVENDYTCYYVFNVSDPNNFEYVDSVLGSINSFINPRLFVYDRTIQKLSTVSGYTYAHIGEDGLIELDSDLYYISPNISFPVIKDIVGYIGDNFDEEYIVKVGSELTYIATDYESFVILFDGSEYILFPSSSSTEISGESVYDVFNNDYILFAG